MTPPNEQPPSLANLLLQLDQGSAHDAMSADLKALTEEVVMVGSAGTLTIKLTLAPMNASMGTLTVKCDHTIKPPKVPATATPMYLTKAGGLSRRDPNQPELFQPTNQEPTNG